MSFFKLSAAICVLSLCAGIISIMAQDNPAQASARVALEQQFQSMTPAHQTVADPQPAATVQRPPDWPRRNRRSPPRKRKPPWHPMPIRPSISRGRNPLSPRRSRFPRPSRPSSTRCSTCTRPTGFRPPNIKNNAPRFSPRLEAKSFPHARRTFSGGFFISRT